MLKAPRIGLCLKPLGICLRTHRLVWDRPLRGTQIEWQTHGHGQGGDIVKQNDSIHAEASGQQGGFYRELDIFREFVKGKPGP